MGLSGNLNTMSFADLLQFISANMSTGTLQIRKGQVLKMIIFEKGKVISSSSSDPKDYLGHFLVSQGLISEEELRIAMEIQRTSKMLLGKILVMGGKISEQEMIRLLKLKTEETVYSLFFWDEGEFTFYQDEFINRLFVRISLDSQGLIFEGTLRRDELMRIRETFPDNNTLLEKVPDVTLDLGATDPQTALIYRNIDGNRTIEELAMAAHCVEYNACRSLYSLFEAGYIQIVNNKVAVSQPKIMGGDHSYVQLLDLSKDKFAKRRYEEAFDILKSIKPTSSGDYERDIPPLMDKAEKAVIHEIYEKWISPDRIPKVLVPFHELAQVQLTPQEGFLLSRIDGVCDVKSILSITPMSEIEALRLLKKLRDKGIIGFSGTESPSMHD